MQRRVTQLASRADDALPEWIVSPRSTEQAVGDDQQLARPHARLLKFRHVTDDQISAPVAFHLLGSLLTRLLIQPTFSGSMRMNCKEQKEISMLRKLSLVTTLAAALTLPTVALAWDGHGGGWGGGGWGHGGGWGAAVGDAEDGADMVTEATEAAGVGMDSGFGSVEDFGKCLSGLCPSITVAYFDGF